MQILSLHNSLYQKFSIRNGEGFVWGWLASVGLPACYSVTVSSSTTHSEAQMVLRYTLRYICILRSLFIFFFFLKQSFEIVTNSLRSIWRLINTVSGIKMSSFARQLKGNTFSPLQCVCISWILSGALFWAGGISSGLCKASALLCSPRKEWCFMMHLFPSNSFERCIPLSFQPRKPETFSVFCAKTSLHPYCKLATHEEQPVEHPTSQMYYQN